MQPASWLAPRVQEEGLARYLRTLRERWWLVVICVVLGVGGAGAYVALAHKVYSATSELLITPVNANDPTTQGLGLITSSNDPTRDVSTGASLVTTTPVAAQVISDLHLKETPKQLLASVTAEPFASTSLVSVTSKASTPARAQAIANDFTRVVVAQRTAQLRAELTSTIPLLRAQIQTQPPAVQTNSSNSLVSRLSGLEALQTLPDPSLRVATPADLPTAASSPRPKLDLIAGLIGGLIIGLAGAFGAQTIDPRLRREEQLRGLFRLPILARIPRERNARKSAPLDPQHLSPATAEAFRTLRATLVASSADDYRSQSILVTGSSPGEGKSTTALNLAVSLAQAGRRVILIEGDLRRPSLGHALGLRQERGMLAILSRAASMESALAVAPGIDPNLRLLLVERPEPTLVDLLTASVARNLVHQAEDLADFVVIDSPPLTEILDALPLAQASRSVLLVVRQGTTRLGKLAQLGEVLAQNGIQPVGIALLGVARPSRDDYYYAAAAQRSPARTPTPS